MSQVGAGRQQTDQAARLRELVRGRGTPTTTIAVTSGKGGVGKSNVAVNLAICLAAKRLRVTLVDADMGLANADLLMDVRPRYTLSHVLSGQLDACDVVVRVPGDVSFVAGASGLSELADLTEFERQTLIGQLQNLEASADIIVVDCGAGISRNVLGFAIAADQVIVVTTAEPTSMTDAYATIKSLHREGCTARIGVLVNMARNRLEAERTYDRLSGVARRFLKVSVAELGYMLHDRAVELAVQERCPFVLRYPESNVAACIAAVATDVSKAFGGRQRRGSFFSRIAGLFM